MRAVAIQVVGFGVVVYEVFASEQLVEAVVSLGHSGVDDPFPPSGVPGRCDVQHLHVPLVGVVGIIGGSGVAYFGHGLDPLDVLVLLQPVHDLLLRCFASKMKCAVKA